MAVALADYTNLITAQYKNSPKFNAWMAVNVQPYIASQNLLATMTEQYFDVETAIGNQLDILGQRVGAKRLLPFQPTGGLDPLLDDTDFRFLVKAKILKNLWKGTNQEVYTIWQNLYSSVFLALTDNQDMTVTALIIGELSDLQKQMVEYGMIVPKAQGVGMIYAFATPPIFAYDQDETFFKGYDEGNWLEFTT